MKNPILIAITGLILLTSCHRKKAEQSSAQNVTAARQIIMAEPPAGESDPVMIESMLIGNNTLTLNVSYSGGCEEHTFDLYFNGMYAKSLPTQATLRLFHNGNGDACRALEKRELKFDLSSLKPPGGNSVILQIADQQISYQLK